jgi:hypothetical protein
VLSYCFSIFSLFLWDLTFLQISETLLFSFIFFIKSFNFLH